MIRKAIDILPVDRKGRRCLDYVSRTLRRPLLSISVLLMVFACCVECLTSTVGTISSELRSLDRGGVYSISIGLSAARDSGFASVGGAVFVDPTVWPLPVTVNRENAVIVIAGGIRYGGADANVVQSTDGVETSRLERHCFLAIRTWFLFVVSSLYPLIAFIRGPLRRWRRRRKGLCVSCGYNLTGNVSEVCPECGTSLPGNRLGAR
jgi:hypothetical protein